MSQPEILSYASPATAKPPSRWLYLLALWGSISAGAIGVLILVLYAIAGAELLTVGGFYWLGIGGGITAVAFILGAIYGLTALSRKYPPPSSRKKAVLVLVLPVVNIGLAAGCFFGGIWLMGYHARSVIIRNKGTTTIDKVELTAPSFNYTSARLDPGESITVHFPSRPQETMTMRVQIGSKIIPYTVMESMHADELRGKRYVHLDGETGYKNRQGSEPD